jgi:hypothetical protein
MWYISSQCVGCRIQKNSVLSMSELFVALWPNVYLSACCGKCYILRDHNLHSSTAQVIFRQEAISVMMVVYEHKK